jgi:hypothetical protein
MENHVLKIGPNSEGERYFVDEIMPNCKDKVLIRLGMIFGNPWNEYEITHEDFLRCREFIKAKKGV